MSEQQHGVSRRVVLDPKTGWMDVYECEWGEGPEMLVGSMSPSAWLAEKSARIADLEAENARLRRANALHWHDNVALVKPAARAMDLQAQRDELAEALREIVVNCKGCDECKNSPWGIGAVDDQLSSAAGGRPWTGCWCESSVILGLASAALAKQGEN